MSTPTLAHATNMRHADQAGGSTSARPATPPSLVTAGTTVLTVKYLSATKVTRLTQAINDLSLAENNRKAARAQIEDADREIIQARADRAAAEVKIAAGIAKMEAGQAGQAAALAQIEDGRTKAVAARAGLDTAKAQLIQQLEKFKGIVNQFYLFKPDDSEATAKIDALIQRITDTQANLPNSSAELKLVLSEIHTAIHTLGKSLKS